MSFDSTTSLIVEKVSSALLEDAGFSSVLSLDSSTSDPDSPEFATQINNPFMFDFGSFLPNCDLMDLDRFYKVASDLIADAQEREGTIEKERVILVEDYPAERFDRFGEEVIATKLISRKPASMSTDELQETTELGIEDSDQLENPENITLETLDKNLENSLDEKTDNLEKQVVEPKLDDDNLHEFNLDVETIDNDQNISLKNPSEVYYEIYKTAYDKAKRIKQAAIEAHLEAQKIKLKYNLDEMLNSDDELSNFSDFDN